MDFIVSKVDIISTENAVLSRTSLWLYMYAPNCYVTCGDTIFMTWRYSLNNSDMTLHVRAKLLCNVWWYDFYDMTLFTE